MEMSGGICTTGQHPFNVVVEYMSQKCLETLGQSRAPLNKVQNMPEDTPCY